MVSFSSLSAQDRSECDRRGRRWVRDRARRMASADVTPPRRVERSRVTDASTRCPRRLSIEPQNIEELTELRDYKSQVPEKLIALKKVIEEAMRNYGVCDELCYKLPEQDFKLRWDLYSWPKKITDECVELEEKCIRLENKQQIEMEEAQAEFAETSTRRLFSVDATFPRRLSFQI